jgi:hypothetical protein
MAHALWENNRSGAEQKNGDAEVGQNANKLPCPQTIRGAPNTVFT